MIKKIKLFDPFLGPEEEKAVKKTLKSHFWASGSGTGTVSKFEEKFGKFIGTKELVAVNSGTAALHLALSLINIKNKEVILPSLSFVATAHAVIYNGAKPIFVDVDEKSLCINIKNIKEKITNKTKVILPVHFGGMPSDLDELQKLCRYKDIILVEDAAHAAGAKYKKKRIGCHGSAVCFSFHPVKNLAMPSGGAIALNSKKSTDWKNMLASSRWCGISNRKGVHYDVNMLGWNYYMNEISAAIGLVQLSRLDKLNMKRLRIAKRYSEEININKKMSIENGCSYHLFWIRVKRRERFMKMMNQAGIETGIHYKPIHKMSFYNTKTKLPITEKVGDEIVTLPIHPNLTDSDVDFIIKMTNKLS